MRVFVSLLLAIVAFTSTHSSLAQGNNSPNLLPICGPVTSGDITAWLARDGQAIFNDGEVAAFSEEIGEGLYSDCVSQHRLFLREESSGSGTTQVPDRLVTLDTTSAISNVINPSAGNGQIITLSAGAGVLPAWGGCYPAAKNCPAATYLTDGFSAGPVYYRRRSDDGTFKGGWSVAFQTRDVGFTMRRMPSCTSISSSTCNFELIFPTDFGGNPVFAFDTQVILKVGFIVREGGVTVYQGNLGIPLYIAASSSSAPPTATPTKTPVLQPNKCNVPDVKGLKLGEAKAAIKLAQCSVGEVTKVTSKNIAKNFVISTSPKAGKVLKLKAKVAIKVSRGKKAAK